MAENELKPFQKIPAVIKVVVFDGGNHGYLEIESGDNIVFASHAPGALTEAKIDLCFNSEVPAKYKNAAAKVLVSYRKEKKKGDSVTEAV